MKKNWFKTRNNSIIDLNVFDAFDAQETPWNGGYSVFASIKCNENSHIMGVFETKEEAIYYIKIIYKHLNKYDLTPIDSEIIDYYRRKFGISNETQST